MSTKNITESQILETLKWQPLSQEEKDRRHILGRLYGPIATFGEPTRNGRFYNKELWTKALNDEIFLEKVSHKNLLLELEHPTDRDALDAKQACACIPEVPKIVGNDLYAVIDVLDLPNGRILKNLIDYGYVPGISSRGSGDLNGNNEVDPESFFLETWDIVSLPAVKKARLSVCESLNRGKTLNMALRESFARSSEEDKLIMQETLNKLNIKLDEDTNPKELPDSVMQAVEDKVQADAEAVLDKTFKAFEGLEEAKIDTMNDVTYKVTPKNIDDIPEVDAAFEGLELSEDVDDEEIEEIEEVEAEEPVAEEETTEEVVEDEETEETDELTVANIIDDFKTLGEDKVVKFDNVEIDGVEYETTIEIGDESEDTVTLKTVLTPVNQDEDKEDADNSTEEEDVEEADDETEEAVDDGDDEVAESFKELVRQKDLLESEVRALKSDKTVSDAKVAELQEALDKYKAAFTRTSELAAQTVELKNLNENLNKTVATQNKKIAELKAGVNTKALNESLQAEATKIKSLTEKLNTVQVEFTKTKTTLESQVSQYKEAYTKRTKLAESYKTKFLTVVERYIKTKAQMLGVRPAEITSRLNESYTLDDVDAACESILNSKVNIGRMPISGNAKVRINESKASQKATSVDSAVEGGIPLDDSLLDFIR